MAESPSKNKTSTAAQDRVGSTKECFPLPQGWIMSAYRRISPGEEILVQDLSENCSLRGYQRSKFKTVCYCIFNAILFGIPSLLVRWSPQWQMSVTCKPCSLVVAEFVLVKDENKELTICKVRIDSVEFIPDEYASRSASARKLEHQDSKTPLYDAENAGSVYRYFIFHEEKYIWDDDKDLFKRLEGLTDVTCVDIVEKFRGICHNRRKILTTIYGSNEIFIEVKSYYKLLVDEVLNPFYIFQVLSVTLWCLDEYYAYAICVVIISGGSILMTLRETRQQSIHLQTMARCGDSLVTVILPSGEEAVISSRDLVPGDVLLIPSGGCIMPCDAIITEGKCIVNESMLTGESVPVNKSAVVSSSEVFNCESHKRHVLFSGTDVIQPRYYPGSKVACVVVRTGFSTLKGQLIRSIMFPKEANLKFYSDSIKFVLLLFCVALCGVAYGIYLYASRGTTWYILLVRVLDIITIVVPPALPAAMTVGIFNAQARLKKHNIFCISPQRINFCGKLKLICFDKTGTLTEDGLNLSCVVPAFVTDEGMETFDDPVTDPQKLGMSSHLLRGMAACHSLTYVDGKLVGDPLDLKMFESTGWSLEEPVFDGNVGPYDSLAPSVAKKGDTELGIMHTLEFTPQLQRMSVITTSLVTQEKIVYCKGAPEKIRPLCKSVPDNFDKVLDSFTLKGYRVLALAWKQIQLSWHRFKKAPRQEIESDLHFAGFLIMQNSLKPSTIPVIKDLTSASIRCVMVTGDNMLTALSVARECGMIPPQDKVVIVDATDNGELEYTLSAQHYEVSPNDTSEMDAPETSRVSNNNGENQVSFLPGDEEQQSCVQGLHQLTKRFSLNSNASETLLDIERLVPIGSELLGNSSYHFALTGKTWSLLEQNCSKLEFQRIVAKGTVFARMSPECKMQLVEALQEMDYTVAMCGDGANDCSALSAAHVGISLSDAEASVAAPFTSKTPDISCVPKLIQEGRCALVTSFGIFKYMALYSMVQFASVLILYTNYTNLADAHFLWIDLAITSTVTLAMGRTGPVRRLVSKRPMGSLISFANVFSIFSQILVSVVLQVYAMSLLKSQEWFIPVEPSSADDLPTRCWETTTIFTVSSFQYLLMSVVFSKGKPFRKPFYLNRLLLLAIVVLTGFTTLLMVYPVSFLASFFSLEPVSSVTQNFRYLLLVLPLTNTVISLILENIVSQSWPVKWFGKRVWKREKNSLYKEILANIDNDSSWPPVKAA